MNKQDISVHDKSVFVGIWNYIKPDLKPDKDGNVMLVKMLCFGPLEWWECSMDKDSKFWWEHQWCENDLYEAENFREEYPQEKMIEKMQQMQNFFGECGLDEYVKVYKKAEQFVREQKRIAD